MSFQRVMLAASLSCMFAVETVAAQPGSAAGPPIKWGGFGWLSGNTADFRHGTTANRGIGSRGWGFEMGGGVSYAWLLGGIDFGINAFKDDSSFTQSTTGGSRESSTSALFGSVFTGLVAPHIPLTPSGSARLRVGALLGYSGWSGNRGIGQCVNCSSESLEMHAGQFVEPFIVIGPKADGWLGLRIGYRRFLSPDATLNSVLSLGVGGGRTR